MGSYSEVDCTRELAKAPVTEHEPYVKVLRKMLALKH